MHNMGHISGTGGTEVGPTIQEADRFFLMDASARDHNDRSANGYGSGGQRGERSGQTAPHEGMRVGQVNWDAAGSTKRKRDTKSHHGYLTEEKWLMVSRNSNSKRSLVEDELRRQSDEIVDEMNKGRVCR